MTASIASGINFSVGPSTTCTGGAHITFSDGRLVPKFSVDMGPVALRQLVDLINVAIKDHGDQDE